VTMPVISGLNGGQLSELISSIARAPQGAFAACDQATLLAAAAKLTGSASAAPAAPAADLTGGAFVDAAISSAPVVVFSKTTCPFCKKVKSLLSSYISVDDSSQANVIEINNRSDMAEIQDHLLAKVGKRSVPQVFIGGNHLGGCDDTVAAHDNGKLQSLIDNNSATKPASGGG